jgi:C4-dicarboxylate-binding protein DctP
MKITQNILTITEIHTNVYLENQKKGFCQVKKVYIFVTILLFAFTLAACSGGGSSSTESETADNNPTESGEAATDDRVYNLTLSYYASESIPPGQAVLEAVKYAEENSNGRLKIDAYFSGTYVSKDDTMASLSTGVIDIAPCEASQIASVSKLNQIFNALLQADLPKDRKAVQQVYVNMIENIPELNQEMIENSNCRWIYPFVMGGHNLHGNVRVEDIDDFKGLKVESHGIEGIYTNMLGGTAVELDAGDYYNGMKLGTVDAQMMHWAVLNNYQVNEVVKYHTIFGSDEIGSGLTMPSMGYFINNDTWNSLPEDLQTVLRDAFIVGANYVIEADNGSYQEAITFAKDAGHEFIYIEGDARKPWAAAMQPILEAWFAECEAAGYDGKSVYDEMCRQFEAAL